MGIGVRLQQLVEVGVPHRVGISMVGKAGSQVLKFEETVKR